ncbi:MAG TPA: outer membrane protein assembly factor [Microscillaceae bacterium]|jgi:outer membrane protein assembly factor BamA|nr:outer membrane protein assembly factor [Microscillaceae bacterium]
MPCSLRLGFLFLLGWMTANVLPLSAQQAASEEPTNELLAEGALANPMTAKYFVLSDIVLRGNKVTKPHIIFRELDIQIGDSLPAAKVDTILFRNKNKIFNTNLFITVDLALELNSRKEATLLIQVKERWYTFPLPIFELADRNINEWIQQRGADIGRVNYGVRFIQRNFRGRNERLEVLIQQGFVRRYGISYTVPYLTKSLKWGLELKANFTENNSIAFNTLNHQLQFINSDKLMRTRWQYALALTYRPKFYSFHKWELKNIQTSIADTVAEANPRYFLNGKRSQNYFSFKYEFRRDLRDVIAYPLRGNFLKLEVQKDGLGLFQDTDQVNMLHLGGIYAIYRELTPKGGWFMDATLNTRLSFMDQQPYANAQGLGYNEEFLRGFELYVIDGQSYALSQNTVKKRLFDIVTRAKFIPLEQFRTIPLAVYLNLFFDAGYVNDRFFTDVSNRFSNRLIYGFGLGLDVFTYYNSVFRFSYAFNSAWERGFFVSFKGDF